ncbi:nuclear transport factor 2 family protein [Kitasatospora sp. NE20-6]|uniref:nuclear transport factor 2 family protein n=1 Tax=Kitasatospora sp. NE20-6 TaxID=2859066 RepID=UPI0038B2B2F5
MRIRGPAFFREDSTWTLAGDLPLSRTWTGPDEILGEFVPAMVARLLPGTMEFSVDGVLADGDRVLAEWNTRATTRTGHRYDQHCLAVITVRDGRLADVREYLDSLHARTTVFARAAGGRARGQGPRPPGYRLAVRCGGLLGSPHGRHTRTPAGRLRDLRRPRPPRRGTHPRLAVGRRVLGPRALT